MDESQFRIEYSWEDLKPVRPLVVTLIAVQVAGNKVMARRIGLIALLLSLTVFVFSLEKF